VGKNRFILKECTRNEGVDESVHDPRVFRGAAHSQAALLWAARAGALKNARECGGDIPEVAQDPRITRS
jgi:hypothetical protein